ncbi:hypothetical protein GJ496_008776 [Pomphorhynchus laevis]|nr:hypothetical protein GJ496_008776 [Pomphorhynchus laevis]
MQFLHLNLNSMIYPVAAPYPVVNSCPSADPYPVAYPYPVIKPSAALCPCVGPPAILPGQSDMPCILSYDIWDSLLPNKCPCPCMMCRTNNKQRKFELLQKLTNSKVPVVMDCH